MNTTTSFHDLPPHKRLRILQQQQKDQQPCSPLPTKKRKESRNASFRDSPNDNPSSPPPPSLFSLPTKKRIRAFQSQNDDVPPFDLNIEYNPSPEKQLQQTPCNDETENDNDNDNDDGILCCVCQSTDANAEDPIVFCDGCDLMVHASCYGNPLSNKIPDGDWFCQRCRFQTESKNDVVCSLCPNKEGAMKRTTEEGKWAHIVCALLVPEVFFLDPEGREGIDFSRVPKKRWLQKCYVCDCDGGCALVCTEQKCELGFHITCGINEDLCIEYMEGKKGSTVVAGFCKTHTQLWEKQQLSGKYKIVAVDDKKHQK